MSMKPLDQFEQNKEVMRVCAAQVASDFGFSVAQESSLDIMSDVMIKFVREIGIASGRAANLSGRTDVNGFDVSFALSEMGISTEDLTTFYAANKDATFPKALPIPLKNKKVSTISTEQQDGIPSALPLFPDARTYQATAMDASFETDPQIIRATRLKLSSNAEASLLKIKQIH